MGGGERQKMQMKECMYVQREFIKVKFKTGQEIILGFSSALTLFQNNVKFFTCIHSFNTQNLPMRLVLVFSFY